MAYGVTKSYGTVMPMCTGSLVATLDRIYAGASACLPLGYWGRLISMNIQTPQKHTQ